MPATATDRLNGLTTSVAVKPPCRVATTANITLSGLQTIDGIALATGDRVLVKSQTNTVNNGIYEANTSAWERAPDFDGVRDAVKGTIVLVQAGSLAPSYFELTTADPVVIGTSSLTFVKALTASSALLSFLQSGANAVDRPVQDKLREVAVSIEDYWLAGMSDYTLALQRAVTAVGANGTVELNGIYAISASSGVAIQISAKNVTFRGRKSSELQFTGEGVAIQLGTDDGLNWDAGNYNGVAQGFCLDGVLLKCVNDGTVTQPRTALLNTMTGGRYYGTGTYGIRDWRGGRTKLKNKSQIEGFQYGYWGVQADINRWDDGVICYNSVGAYLGARSDQGTYEHIWTFGNDTAWLFEGSKGNRVTHWVTDTDGSATTAPAIVRNSSPARSARYATTRTQHNNRFIQPWCEQFGSFGQVNPGYDVPYLFDINVGDAALGGGFVIEDPLIADYPYSDATKPHFLYLVRAGYVQSVEVTRCSGIADTAPWTNMRAVFYIDAAPASTPRIFFSDSDNQFGGRLIENFNAVVTFVQVRSDGFDNTYLANAVGGTGAVNIGALGLHKALRHDNAPLTAGAAGDIALNRIFSAGKSLGWAWHGSAAVVIHAPTVSGDRGDADRTVTPETDEEDQTFGTNLTADRTCVLAAPPAAARGHRFRITRSGGGAFNLNVRNLTGGGALLKAIPATSWADFMYDGTNWSLRAFGSL